MNKRNRVYPDQGVLTYGHNEIKLLRKNEGSDGFSVQEDAELDPLKRIFVDGTKKIVIDNSVPYGHLTTIWLYLLLIELERSEGPVTVLLYKSPNTRQMRLEHSSTFTEYLEQRLIDMGHIVKYMDVDEFYINNFTTFLMTMNISQSQMFILSEFLSEGLDYSEPPTEKIYLSRGKTTTQNGNRNMQISIEKELLKDELSYIRNKNVYSFSDRIDDEQALEEYLKTLGFLIVYPEDLDSYKDQLQLFASSKIVMSLTSSSLSVCSAMAPNTFIVELTSPMYTQVDESGELIEESEAFHDTYKNISLIQSNLYMSISNRYKKASIVIESIESNPALKAFLSS